MSQQGDRIFVGLILAALACALPGCAHRATCGCRPGGAGECCPEVASPAYDVSKFWPLPTRPVFTPRVNGEPIDLLAADQPGDAAGTVPPSRGRSLPDSPPRAPTPEQLLTPPAEPKPVEPDSGAPRPLSVLPPQPTGTPSWVFTPVAVAAPRPRPPELILEAAPRQAQAQSVQR